MLVEINFLSVNEASENPLSVNAKIHLSGLDETSVSVGTIMIVTCTIDCVYPALGPEDFQMRWGTQTTMSTASQNNDKTYQYTIQHSHSVTNDDNGTVLECFVNPSRGQSDSISRTLIVKAKSKLA